MTERREDHPGKCPNNAHAASKQINRVLIMYLFTSYNGVPSAAASLLHSTWKTVPTSRVIQSRLFAAMQTRKVCLNLSASYPRAG